MSLFSMILFPYHADDVSWFAFSTHDFSNHDIIIIIIIYIYLKSNIHCI